jgi:fructose/tagatose bisphosphate aldolase
VHSQRVFRCDDRWLSTAFEDNIASLVKRVVDVAHSVGCRWKLNWQDRRHRRRYSGMQKMPHDDQPDEAAEFVRRAQPDLLAVAIGTAHGVYKGEPRIDFERLEEIKKRVDIPLVLHGASGVPDEAIRKACQIGISKINIDTELRVAFSQAVQRTFWKLLPRDRS